MRNVDILKMCISSLERDYRNFEFDLAPAMIRALREEIGAEKIAQIITVHPDKAHFQYKGEDIPESIQREYDRRYEANLRKIQDI